MRPDLRLAVPVAAAWIALAVAVGAPQLLPVTAVVGWCATGACLVAAVVLARSARPSRTVVVVLLGLAASSMLLTAGAVEAPHRRPPVLVEAAASGRFVTATATLTETARAGDGSFTVVLDRVRLGRSEASARAPARVFGEAATVTLGLGATVQVSGTLAATDPGDDLAFLLFTSAPPDLLGAPTPPLAWAEALRAGLLRAGSALPGDGGDLLPGLAIGDTTAVTPTLDEAMKSSSLSHLTAVSGANCAVVIGLVMVAGGAVGLGRTTRIVVSLVVLVGFVVLVTPSPSVLRAAVMAGIALVALARGRPARGLPVVALAVAALLTVDPWLARDYGFVLSVLATVGLLVLAGPLTSAFERLLPRPIAAAVAIPLAAQLACQPVLILLAPSIPTYGVLANMLAGPAAPVATVLGLIACVLLPVVPPAGLAVAQLAWAPAAWIAAVAGFVDGLPGNGVPWPPGAVGVVLVVVVTALALVAALGRPGRMRRVAATALAVAMVGYGGVVAGTAARTALSRPTDWQYAACDIGQGDAMLVRSDGEVALVDTGPDPALLSACLDALGVGRLDLLVLTHFDLDHVGGVAAVVGRADAAIVGPSDGVEADRLTDELRDGGAVVREVAAGVHGSLGGLRWTVLWPPPAPQRIEPGNDASVVLRFDAAGPCADGCLGSMFLGDLGEESQTRLLGAGGAAPVDVVKVAHHGSADQSARLYERLDARVGLIGVGADNDYGHPTGRLLDLLARSGTAVARTDREGLVLVAPGGRGGGAIRIWSERGG